ncbi:hypothetical protein [uncultured Brevundimonas sp.]|uniref:hypothetical protein n=1 Tax=uncultured Brevundimonas sp. TaxID=213418 RepID=UPI0030ED954B|tara:strand:+ start:256 stop:426 length:171 start_codon:yes stop_codon:yes gene_type:complete
MADPRENMRIRHGLVPLLVAMRVMAERKAREEKAAREAEDARDGKPRKRRRRRWFS